MGRAYQNRKESMAKTSDSNSKIYSKYSRELYVCAKNGGVELDGNLALRRLVEKAKKDQVPAHVIEKAIDKAKGGGGEDFVVVRFEGFGPGSSMVIVECLTDNNNRTFGDVRQCFTKTKGKIGAQGAVAHMFDHRSIFEFKGDDEEAVLEALMEADVDVSDLECEDGLVTVLAPPTEFAQARNALTDAFPDLEFDIDEIGFIPQATCELSEEEMPQFEKLLEMLNDNDDVQQIYHNVEL
ncbi:MAG: YebC/PmpR family DNA-binding transcriptional regulator [Gammaproteobacteria bacterium]|nr:YebC/PmpR family DNA-binding transcriptional regulator [Gammaproteobacteria bacterium]